MTDERRLTLEEKQTLCTVVQLGCDRTTARNYVGASASQLRVELQHDPLFAHELSRAEASAELQHMRNVHEAAKSEKNWRTSVWWLERRAPERFGQRDLRAMSPLQWSEVVRELGDAIVTEVDDADLCQRVINRLEQIAAAAAVGVCESETPVGNEGDENDDPT